jgi:DNA-3-methyladenine glycosylase
MARLGRESAGCLRSTGESRSASQLTRPPRLPSPRPESLGRPPPIRFFRRSSLELAPELLGLILWRESDDGIAAGRIVEVEAYCGPDDLAAHSAGGRRTPRTEVMYAPGGVAYVYFVYGMHYCANVVAGERGAPEAVLLRAAEPEIGLDLMRGRRRTVVPAAALARGPGNLARAFAIDARDNGADLRTGPLRVLVPHGQRAGEIVTGRDIVRSPRIGVQYAGAWAAKPWRFSLSGHPSVSRPPNRRS